jgi:hypothetical protein
METIKKIIVAVVIVGTFSIAPVAYGATQAEIKAEITVLQSYIERIESILKVLKEQVRVLESQLDRKPKAQEVEKKTEAKVVKEVRYTITLPAGSSVKKPKSEMTLEELRTFTANLFHRYDSSYNMLLNADESKILDFLKTNGYKVKKERI